MNSNICQNCIRAKFFPIDNPTAIRLSMTFWFSKKYQHEKNCNEFINGYIYTIAEFEGGGAMACKMNARISNCEEQFKTAPILQYGYSTIQINNELMSKIELEVLCPYYMEHLLLDENSDGISTKGDSTTSTIF